MNLSTFTIELSNVELLQKCLGVSTGLHANNIINLTISNETITSTTSNAVDSCYKHWVLPIKNIGEVVSDKPLLQPIKCSIFKGVEFSSKILSQVKQKDTVSSITFFYDEVLSNVKQIEVICKSKDKGKKIFSFKFNSSDVSLIFTEFDDETIEFCFSQNSPATKVYEFVLFKDDLKKLRSLMNLDIHDDTQEKFISVKFFNDTKQISFTDEITDFRLDEKSIIHEMSDELCSKKFNIDKSVFKSVDASDYVVQLREFEGSSMIVLFNTSEHVKYVTTIPLLEELSTSVSYEDVLKDKGYFG